MVEMLVGMAVGAPVGMYIWGMFGERITAWFENMSDE